MKIDIDISDRILRNLICYGMLTKSIKEDSLATSIAELTVNYFKYILLLAENKEERKEMQENEESLKEFIHDTLLLVNTSDTSNISIVLNNLIGHKNEEFNSKKDI